MSHSFFLLKLIEIFLEKFHENMQSNNILGQQLKNLIESKFDILLTKSEMD